MWHRKWYVVPCIYGCTQSTSIETPTFSHTSLMFASHFIGLNSADCSPQKAVDHCSFLHSNERKLKDSSYMNGSWCTAFTAVPLQNLKYWHGSDSTLLNTSGSNHEYHKQVRRQGPTPMDWIVKLLWHPLSAKPWSTLLTCITLPELVKATVSADMNPS